LRWLGLLGLIPIISGAAAAWERIQRCRAGPRPPKSNNKNKKLNKEQQQYGAVDGAAPATSTTTSEDSQLLHDPMAANDDGMDPEAVVEVVDLDDEEDGGVLGKTTSSVCGTWLHRHTLQVAAVALAQAGDNFAVFFPLFATTASPWTMSILTIVVFLVLMCALMALALLLIRCRMVAEFLSKHGKLLVPFGLIAIGVYIIISNDTLSLFGL
jgi:cadmium resistance protein CadD (predicted permease)